MAALLRNPVALFVLLMNTWKDAAQLGEAAELAQVLVPQLLGGESRNKPPQELFRVFLLFRESCEAHSSEEYRM
ncbi:MAG: hypothetical protein ACLU0O_07130 [Collinsella sp.]